MIIRIESQRPGMNPIELHVIQLFQIIVNRIEERSIPSDYEHDLRMFFIQHMILPIQALDQFFFQSLGFRVRA